MHTFEFKVIEKIELNVINERYSRLITCYFIENTISTTKNKKISIVVQTNTDTNIYLDVYNIEHNTKINKLTYDVYSTDLKNLNLGNGYVRINPQNNLIVIFSSNLIQYFDPSSGFKQPLLIYKFKSNFTSIKSVTFLQNTSDVFVYADNDLVYYELSEDKSSLNELCRIRIDGSRLDYTRINNDNNLIVTNLNTFLYVIKLNHVKQARKFIEDVNLINILTGKCLRTITTPMSMIAPTANVTFDGYAITTDNKYFVYFTRELELILVRLDDLKVLAVLPLHTSIVEIRATDRYVALSTQNEHKLLVFVIIDNDNEAHFEKINELNFFLN